MRRADERTQIDFRVDDGGVPVRSRTLFRMMHHGCDREQSDLA
ncbi:hypothetical protein [Zymomonas mobilis]|nr:hypothetical protein [Zymomonas mobilis]